MLRARGETVVCVFAMLEDNSNRKSRQRNLFGGIGEDSITSLVCKRTITEGKHGWKPISQYPSAQLSPAVSANCGPTLVRGRPSTRFERQSREPTAERLPSVYQQACFPCSGLFLLRSLFHAKRNQSGHEM